MNSQGCMMSGNLGSYTSWGCFGEGHEKMGRIRGFEKALASPAPHHNKALEVVQEQYALKV